MRRMYSPVIAAISAMTFLTTGAQAQTIGFKLGAAFSNMSGDLLDVTTSGTTGFIGGGHVRFGFGGRIGLQAELLSVTKGADFTGSDAPDNFNYRFEYVELPVTLFVPLVAGVMAPYVFGGAALGFEVRCRVTPTGAAEGAGIERDCGEAGVGLLNRRSPDISLVGGGGLSFAMGPGTVLIEGRYTAGMRSINEATGIGGADLRHRTTSLMAGFEIPLGRRW